MKMNPLKPILLVPLLMAMLPACNTLTHSPIVFTSRQTIGVDVRPTSADTRTPGITIGIRSSDFAWVPAVGIGGCAKWQDEGVTSADRDYISKNWLSKCERQALVPEPLLARSDEIKDVLSVYGQFDANVGGFGGDPDRTIAKVFAVGLAANFYSDISSARARNECLQAIDKFIDEKIAMSTVADVNTGKGKIAALLKRQCGDIAKKGTK